MGIGSSILGNKHPKIKSKLTVGADQNALIQQTSRLLGGVMPGAISGLNRMATGPFDNAQAEGYFQQGVVNPAMDMWRREGLPGIEAQYAGKRGFHSSAKRSGIAREFGNLQTKLSGMQGQFMADQLGAYQTRQANALNTLFGGAQGIGGTQTRENIVTQPRGLLDRMSPVLSAVGAGAGAYMGASAGKT
jgi:hypothetical protein